MEEEIREENGTEKAETVTDEIQKQLDESLKKVEEAEKKIAETNDKYLRVMAEYDNFRKRTAKERDFIYSEAYADAVKQILPIIDNLERAKTFTEGDKVAEGLSMILSSIPETLKKMNVTEIETKTFDPNVHNAVMHIDDENFGEGEIVEVFQKGYKVGDKVIRHAMVKVAN